MQCNEWPLNAAGPHGTCTESLIRINDIRKRFGLGNTAGAREAQRQLQAVEQEERRRQAERGSIELEEAYSEEERREKERRER